MVRCDVTLGCLTIIEPSKVLAPLNDVIKGHTKRNDKTLVKWTPALTEAFENAKRLFSDFTLLHYPRNDSVLYLIGDASKGAVGAVLEQVGENGIREPLGYYSEKLNETRRRWDTYDRELYALYAGTCNFEYLIEGREVIYVTDHSPLLHMFSSKKRCRIQRRSRHIEYLAQFSNQIQHVTGRDNVIADHLSRPESENEEEIVNAVERIELTMEKLAELQQSDPDLENLSEEVKRVTYGDVELVCVVRGEKVRPYVP